eukprot:6210544-Pleurochrysis_carterae.AAC.1
MPRECRDVIDSMLQISPLDRARPKEILQSDWARAHAPRPTANKHKRSLLPFHPYTLPLKRNECAFRPRLPRPVSAHAQAEMFAKRPGMTALICCESGGEPRLEGVPAQRSSKTLLYSADTKHHALPPPFAAPALLSLCRCNSSLQCESEVGVLCVRVRVRRVDALPARVLLLRVSRSCRTSRAWTPSSAAIALSRRSDGGSRNRRTRNHAHARTHARARSRTHARAHARTRARASLTLQCPDTLWQWKALTLAWRRLRAHGSLHS